MGIQAFPSLLIMRAAGVLGRGERCDQTALGSEGESSLERDLPHLWARGRPVRPAFQSREVGVGPAPSSWLPLP